MFLLGTPRGLGHVPRGLEKKSLGGWESWNIAKSRLADQSITTLQNTCCKSFFHFCSIESYYHIFHFFLFLVCRCQTHHLILMCWSWISPILRSKQIKRRLVTYKKMNGSFRDCDPKKLGYVLNEGWALAIGQAYLARFRLDLDIFPDWLEIPYNYFKINCLRSLGCAMSRVIRSCIQIMKSFSQHLKGREIQISRWILTSETDREYSGLIDETYLDESHRGRSNNLGNLGQTVEVWIIVEVISSGKNNNQSFWELFLENTGDFCYQKFGTEVPMGAFEALMGCSVRSMGYSRIMQGTSMDNFIIKVKLRYMKGQENTWQKLDLSGTGKTRQKPNLLGGK
ncbi:hypothetical protein VP01_1031g1 [Puccinia sorghi]|uniref:Uncharacterized protein n=1 Tax=Puccinia sorghi TaxID=27349 RepID=A0A0L6VUJ6_9BASI|nr:hypothetical protein VP01_1031g1 [Puccinia sorghi]